MGRARSGLRAGRTRGALAGLPLPGILGDVLFVQFALAFQFLDEQFQRLELL